jgi:hypothetical protein
MNCMILLDSCSGHGFYTNNIVRVSFDLYVWQCYKFCDIMNIGFMYKIVYCESMCLSIQNEDSCIMYVGHQLSAPGGNQNRCWY